MKKLSLLFSVLAVLLMNVMCAVVGFRYGQMIGGIRQGYSAPPSTAFLLAIPYALGILICVGLAVLFWKRGQAKSR